MAESQVDQIVKNSQKLKLFCGLPGQRTTEIDAFRAEGGSIIYVVSPEEVPGLALKTGERAVVWESDTKIRMWLHDNLTTWTGGQIDGDMTRVPKLAQILTEIVELHNFDQRSMDFLGKDKMPTRNALRNFRYVQDGIPLRRARDTAKDQTAILLMAGPSLNAQWEDLKRIRGIPGHIFIVAGRTYRAAMEHLVYPDFVLEVEQFPWDDKIFMFAPSPPPHTVLCAPLTVCPGVLNAWPTQKMILLDHNTAEIFKPDGVVLREDSIDGGNSIAHHAVNLAAWLGCQTICLAGVDFGYPDGETGKTHADGTFHGWPFEVLVSETNFQEPLMATGNDGKPLRSSPPYRNFATFLEMQIHRFRGENPSLRVYSFSPRGYKVDHVEYSPIDEWKGRPCSQASSSASDLSDSSPLASPSGSQQIIVYPSSTSETQPPPSPEPQKKLEEMSMKS